MYRILNNNYVFGRYKNSKEFLMLQVYFLSVLFLIVGGISLLTQSLGKGFQIIKDFFGRRLVKSLLGTISLLVGVLKLFIRAPFDTVAVAGDLLPAVIGIILGFALIFDPYITEKAGEESSETSSSASAKKVKEPNNLNKIAAQIRVPLSVVAIATGVLHLIFASLPVL
jgi:hypothetical protein